MPERVSFSTDDGVTIVGDWEASSGVDGAVILLHMMPATRQSWLGFQQTLAKRGLASLAIDLRGHGESVHGPKGAMLRYQDFSDEEHAASIQDVWAAYRWILSRSADAGPVGIAGASIGANLALQFLSEEPHALAAALLSPGETYHGVDALAAAEKVLPGQSVWIAASAEDDAYSDQSSRRLIEALPTGKKMYQPLQRAGHGTTMFETHPELVEELAGWFKDRLLV